VRKAGQKASKDTNFCEKGINFRQFLQKSGQFLRKSRSFFAVFKRFYFACFAQLIQAELMLPCVFD